MIKKNKTLININFSSSNSLVLIKIDIQRRTRVTLLRRGNILCFVGKKNICGPYLNSTYNEKKKKWGQDSEIKAKTVDVTHTKWKWIQKTAKPAITFGKNLEAGDPDGILAYAIQI